MRATTVYFIMGILVGGAVAGVAGIDISTDMNPDISQIEAEVTEASAGERTSTLTGTPAKRTTVRDGTRAERAEQAIHELVNEERDHQTVKLRYSGRLGEVARGHSKDMAENGYFSHTAPGGQTLQDRYERYGISCSRGGENIYRTSSTGIGPDALARNAVESWMNSAGHRENIMRNQFSEEGIGVYYGEDYVYVTQDFC